MSHGIKQNHIDAPHCLAQVAALPLVAQTGVYPHVLLLTSRETKRWVIPKGWPIKGLKDWQAAAQEALEEAGLVGRTGKAPIGRYTYLKRREERTDLCEVSVYPLLVSRQLKDWPEKSQRETRWFPLREAADLVQEPGLADLLVSGTIADFLRIEARAKVKRR